MTIAEMEVSNHGDGSVLTIVLPTVLSSEDRETLLTDGVFAVVEYLVAADERGDAVAVVDLRVEETLPRTDVPSLFAFIEAARGIAQSFVREMAERGPATNVVISTRTQDRARTRTLDYLRGEGGRFSSGATYDLRGE